jgi:hypothetical protein
VRDSLVGFPKKTKFEEKIMKMEKLDNLQDLVIIYTPEEAEMINGGRRGADDAPGDDRGGGRRNDDGPGHT